MAQYIDKSELVAEIEKRINGLKDCHADTVAGYAGEISGLERLLSFINTLDVKDPYEQCIQYPSIKDGIKAHAETYSFNIESELFNQLTKEQQKLWRKEIEQACISGGNAGVGLARDIRYKESLKVKEVNLEKLGEIARHLIAVKEHTEDMRLDKEEWFMLEKIGYPERFKAQKGE